MQREQEIMRVYFHMLSTILVQIQYTIYSIAMNLLGKEECDIIWYLELDRNALYMSYSNSHMLYYH